MKKQEENNLAKQITGTLQGGNDKMQVMENVAIVPPFEEVEQSKQPTTWEIAPGMSVEEMRSLFFDADALIEPSYRLFQLNRKGHRYYYRYDENGTPEFYPSVTTILRQTMPSNPFLIKWTADMGYDAAQNYMQERADYGTFMHALFEKLLIAGTYDLDALLDELEEYRAYKQLPFEFLRYADDLKKDVLAFAQFVIDYDVKPLAIEIALVHPIYKYAGMIDLPCTMLASPGKAERITAIVDFKSGRKGFYEEHEVQLGLYREMWNANFENMQIDRIFNFAPKDWRKKPTYNLKDQTDSPSLAKIPFLLELAGIEDNKINNTFSVIDGIIDLGKKDVSGNIHNLTLSELVKCNKQQKKENCTDAIMPPIQPEPKKAKLEQEDKKAVAKPRKATTRKSASKARAKAKEQEKQQTLLNEEIEV